MEGVYPVEADCESEKYEGRKGGFPEMFTSTVPTVFSKQQTRCECGHHLRWSAPRSGPFPTIPLSVKRLKRQA